MNAKSNAGSAGIASSDSLAGPTRISTRSATPAASMLR